MPRRISENDESFEDLLADLEKSRLTIEREELEIEPIQTGNTGAKRKTRTKTGALGTKPRQSPA